MKKSACVLSALIVGSTTALMPAVASAAKMEKMYSPPLYVNNGTLTSCILVNGGDEPVRIFMEIIDPNGVSRVDSVNAECEVGNELEVQPGELCSLLYQNATGGGSALRCEVTVFEKQHKQNVRASFQIRGTVGSTYETSVAVDVR